jgi:RNA polymerase sigma factor (sigma-70 family)
MRPDGADTHWLELLKAGNRDAAQVIWERYFRLLVSFARERLGTASRRAADEEDVALSAFHSFCQGTERGRFPRLNDRKDLRTVLLMLIARKAAHQVRDEHCAKRGGGKVAVETDLSRGDAESVVLDSLMAVDPTPERAAEAAEECRRLLDVLQSDDLRRIAVWQMEGYTVDEMADKLGCAPRTIARKLIEIRERWTGEGQP